MGGLLPVRRRPVENEHLGSCGSPGGGGQSVVCAAAGSTRACDSREQTPQRNAAPAGCGHWGGWINGQKKLRRVLCLGQLCFYSKSAFKLLCFQFLKSARSTDIFGEEKKKKKRHRTYEGEKIQQFTDLSVGDYVVHENHGLGIYKGIEKIEVDRKVKDYIKIEYAGGSNLYILATQLDQIQKYAGKDARKPKLNKLGSQEWTKTKGKVRGAVRQIAQDLVKLYAEREEQNGYMYGPDTVWQREFEELFPFEETEDQVLAIDATKRDMESHKIMENLF